MGSRRLYFLAALALVLVISVGDASAAPSPEPAAQGELARIRRTFNSRSHHSLCRYKTANNARQPVVGSQNSAE